MVVMITARRLRKSPQIGTCCGNRKRPRENTTGIHRDLHGDGVVVELAVRLEGGGIEGA